MATESSGSPAVTNGRGSAIHRVNAPPVTPWL